MHTGRLWYLVAWDVDRRDWRTFRVDRIDGRPVPVARFTPRPPPARDIAAYVSRGTAIEAYPLQGRVVVHAPVEAVAERMSPSAGVLEAIDADSCVLLTGGRTLDTLAYHLVAMGLEFTIEEPAELVEHVRGLARSPGDAPSAPGRPGVTSVPRHR